MKTLYILDVVFNKSKAKSNKWMNDKNNVIFSWVVSLLLKSFECRKCAANWIAFVKHRKGVHSMPKLCTLTALHTVRLLWLVKSILISWVCFEATVLKQLCSALYYSLHWRWHTKWAKVCVRHSKPTNTTFFNEFLVKSFSLSFQ